MNSVIFACLLAVSVAQPSYYDQSPKDHIPILKDDRVNPDADGTYSFDVETGDGISRKEAGTPIHSADGAVGQQGSVSFKLASGEPFDLKFVADENGYQPQSAWLPVAPEPPHPVPQFVLDQIEKARIEDSQPIKHNSPTHRRRYH